MLELFKIKVTLFKNYFTIVPSHIPFYVTAPVQESRTETGSGEQFGRTCFFQPDILGGPRGRKYTPTARLCAGKYMTRV